MKSKKTFDEQWEENKPLRLKAAKEYYANKPKFKTIDEARESGKKLDKRNWICLVKLSDGTEFYTITYFQYDWVKSGHVYGMWNELTLIEKVSSKKEKGGEAGVVSIGELVKMNRGELQRMYKEKFSIEASHQDHNSVATALFLNKRIKYVTEDDKKDLINKTNEYLEKHKGEYAKGGEINSSSDGIDWLITGNLF